MKIRREMEEAGGLVSQVRHERGRDTRNARVRLERVQLNPEVLQTLPTNPEKSVQQPIGDNHTELRLPTSYNPSVLTIVAGNGVRGSIKD